MDIYQLQNSEILINSDKNSTTSPPDKNMSTSMKTSLDHIDDERKRMELETITRMIRKAINVEMIILFGSYARGDAVEELDEQGVYYRYQSDFDILVIVDERKLAKKWRVWERMKHDIRGSGLVKTPVSIITENIKGFNHQLKHGHYFYSDIKEEGILLYDSGKYELAEAKELSPEERQQKAKDDFEEWYESANGFFRQYRNAVRDQNYKIAAFELHQATEQFYSAILLVFTGYKPKIHDIEELGKKAAGQEPEFLQVFPKGTPEEKRLFDLLKRAYVEARYKKKKYKITREELEWLAGRVSKLQELTGKICKEKIASFIS
jgi:predicted nucleotidyltransferase/HEPN domain-containing protein